MNTAREGHLATVELLLDKGATIHSKNMASYFIWRCLYIYNTVSMSTYITIAHANCNDVKDLTSSFNLQFVIMCKVSTYIHTTYIQWPYVHT